MCIDDLLKKMFCQRGYNVCTCNFDVHLEWPLEFSYLSGVSYGFFKVDVVVMFR